MNTFESMYTPTELFQMNSPTHAAVLGAVDWVSGVDNFVTSDAYPQLAQLTNRSKQVTRKRLSDLAETDYLQKEQKGKWSLTGHFIEKKQETQQKEKRGIDIISTDLDQERNKKLCDRCAERDDKLLYVDMIPIIKPLANSGKIKEAAIMGTLYQLRTHLMLTVAFYFEDVAPELTRLLGCTERSLRNKIKQLTEENYLNEKKPDLTKTSWRLQKDKLGIQ